ncbi:esterase/lipase [Clostridium saccharoperbutylacetonicum]|uniref:BAAT/acyl-CoA thioester hydrolase protein n=1 Tax=Clostridium saccharoperbutylacetonicum N1-4(HMT) TaxID=931276 RepID=M1LWI9_9CLOT|nr:acyl-CoA thioesterase/bile acid-CoA:amino acid N-acyltransferase family protein [Clostridium saccharoperbutylacetonicum]AGF57560.1 BAAT/acyl-CoA thioester hydrolase protein [Clostridium saccharoperbutylacetonicum N1-4(HMT)]NRT61672.1 esterase/lipase [Clostridium saccharoperbutylacetonicum]NSB24995.1 esterase/lipase [Clostridium saccharoperbutylacetonicum]NSB44366.1 esterase/lipase [Clostridium saccharoperbutylacetonicum]
MKIEISNIEALITEKIDIKVLELMPNSKVKITLKAELPWCSGEEYSSYGVFISNEKGEVDLDLIEPIEGTYKAKDSMGLIYSLKKTRTVGKNIAENISIDKPMIMHMIFETSDEKKELELKRIFKTDDVIVKNICEEEFNGELFYKENSNNKLILMLGGSDGNMSAIKLMAAPLAARGINVLMVPYFAAGGLPEKLEEVPLEYFEKIFKWIESNTIVSSKEIFLHGTSKGGELALLLASRYKQIKKVVAVEPHAYCFQALNGMNCEKMVSSWSFKNKSIPFIEIDNNIFLEDQKTAIENGVTFGFASSYKKSIEKATNKEEARIKIENSEADLLLITGKEDNIWNSYDGCLIIQDNLKKNNYKHKVELLTCDGMGHPMPVPYIIPISDTLAMNMMGGVFSSGGTIEGNADGQYKSWQRTIGFFMEP